MFITEDEFEKFKLKLFCIHMSKTNSEFVERISEFKITYIIKYTTIRYIKSVRRFMTIYNGLTMLGSGMANFPQTPWLTSLF